MIDFIKWNWKNLLAIALCILGIVAVNLLALHFTQGSYTAFELIFA